MFQLRQPEILMLWLCFPIHFETLLAIVFTEKDDPDDEDNLLVAEVDFVELDSELVVAVERCLGKLLSVGGWDIVISCDVEWLAKCEPVDFWLIVNGLVSVETGGILHTRFVCFSFLSYRLLIRFLAIYALGALSEILLRVILYNSSLWARTSVQFTL